MIWKLNNMKGIILSELNQEQAAMAYQTMRHIEQVRNRLNVCVKELLCRAEQHDQSKMVSPEVDLFTEYTPQLKHVEYGSAEYKHFLLMLQPALLNHYACNSHHPEHYEDGISDMNLMDILEMLVDWSASSMRGKNGDILKSLKLNESRFKIEPQLLKVLENTVKYFKWDTLENIQISPLKEEV